jgi:hypothetical protein
MFTGCWFASGGQGAGGSASANGLKIDATGGIGTMEFTGCIFINNKGTGLHIHKSGQFAVTGCIFQANGLGATANNNYGMYWNAAAADGDGPVITGCYEIDSDGVGLRIGSNSTNADVIGNRWMSGVQYDVQPAHSRHNLGVIEDFRCRAYNNGGQVLTTSTFTKIDLDAETTDVGAMHDNVTNNTRITIPANGAATYVIAGVVQFAANGTGYRYAQVLLNNTTTIGQAIANPVPGQAMSVAVAFSYDLVAGDYIELRGYQNSGGDLAIGSGAANTWLSAVRVN